MHLCLSNSSKKTWGKVFHPFHSVHPVTLFDIGNSMNLKHNELIKMTVTKKQQTFLKIILQIKSFLQFASQLFTSGTAANCLW